MDVREDATDNAELKKIANWTVADRDCAIDDVAAEYPRDLLKRLLDPDESKRPRVGALCARCC